eukprot:m.32614 g.32614  ORF g.32614 m.32614 type:complete len:191 (+) comp16671_c0_seq1:234-806(+)
MAVGIITIVIAAGCFWSVELAFQRLPGVIDTRVGYIGGDMGNPGYAEVSSGRTGHTEAVEVNFNPSKVSFNQIMELFMNIHDPTTKDRQGGDVGTQYRSALFYSEESQKQIVDDKFREYEQIESKKVVTQVAALKNHVFWPAEEYHQRYLQKSGQSAGKGDLSPIQCYGNRGPIKIMDKPVIKALFSDEL